MIFFAFFSIKLSRFHNLYHRFGGFTRVGAGLFIGLFFEKRNQYFFSFVFQIFVLFEINLHFSLFWVILLTWFGLQGLVVLYGFDLFLKSFLFVDFFYLIFQHLLCWKLGFVIVFSFVFCWVIGLSCSYYRSYSFVMLTQVNSSRFVFVFFLPNFIILYLVGCKLSYIIFFPFKTWFFFQVIVTSFFNLIHLILLSIFLSSN